jgi:hypothetical protein
MYMVTAVSLHSLGFGAPVTVCDTVIVNKQDPEGGSLLWREAHHDTRPLLSLPSYGEIRSRSEPR